MSQHTIKTSVVGDREYAVLLNADGQPVAQGAFDMVTAVELGLQLGDTVIQTIERLSFRRVLDTPKRSKREHRT